MSICNSKITVIFQVHIVIYTMPKHRSGTVEPIFTGLTLKKKRVMKKHKGIFLTRILFVIKFSVGKNHVCHALVPNAY